MKKALTYVLMAFLAILVSCSELSLDGGRNETGRDIRFGAESNLSFLTKTSYSGDAYGSMERINWVDGDRIHIYSAEAQGTDADYSVTGTDKSGRYHSGSIAPVAESMKWGEAATHTFYSMYPAPGHTGVLPGVSMSGNVITAVLPTDQSYASSRTDDNGDVYYGDMNLAYMTAATKGQLGSSDDVMLSFSPIVTTFYVTIVNDYPDSHDMNLRRIVLSSASNAITGTYRTTMGGVVDKDNYTRSYTYAESGYNPTVVRTDANSFISFDWAGGAVHAGESVTVALFALPQDMTQMTLTVYSDEGKSSLELKRNGTWLYFDGGKKHNISNVGVPECTYDIDICGVDDTPASLAYTYTAGASELGAFSVRSRKSLDGGATWIPTPWKAQYWDDLDGDGIEDDGEWFDVVAGSYPDWLEGITPSSGTPATAGYEGTGYAVTMTARQVQSHEETLRTRWTSEIAAQTRVNTGSSVPRVDLSKWDFVAHAGQNRTTANCYIVQGPGEYVFPMAYGNAIDYAFKSSSDNTESYNPGGAYADYLDQFRTHVSVATEYVGISYPMRIHKPWLSRHETETTALDFDDNFGHHCTEVGVLWQDFKNGEDVITNVGWYDENTYANDASDRMIYFTVGQNVSPGNAVIYVKDDKLDVIAWSWHIWITGQTLAPVGMRNASGTVFSVQPVNLGWVDDSEGLYYPERTGKIRFVCIEHEATVSPILTLEQADHEDESVSGWAPYYQWGRKDPMMAGSELVNDEPHHHYYSIRHPEKFLSAKDPFQDEYDWSDNDYSNLWRATNRDKGSSALSSLVKEKTVYDPCPRGYKVPAGNSWTGLDLTGTYVSGKGRYFSTASGGTLFFPAKGYLDGQTASVTQEGTSGVYWLDVPSSGTARNSYCMNYSSGALDVQGYVDRATGLSVRCEREDTNTFM